MPELCAQRNGVHGRSSLFILSAVLSILTQQHNIYQWSKLDLIVALRLVINGGGYLYSGDRLNRSIGLDVCASYPLSGYRAHNSSLKTLKLFSTEEKW